MTPKQFSDPIIICKRCSLPFQRTGSKQWYCKPCAPHGERERAAERARERRAEDPERAKRVKKEWSQNNRDHEREYAKRRHRSLGVRAMGSAQVCECGSQFVLTSGSRKHCDDCRATVVRQRKIDRAATWNKENAARRSERSIKKYSEDPALRLNNLMSGGIKRGLVSGKCGRSWKDLVDFSIPELKRHLERQFVKGMSWENMGEWHIDHRLPLASFEFSSPDDEEFKAAWSITNLQPLWAPDNCKKSDAIIYLL